MISSKDYPHWFREGCSDAVFGVHQVDEAVCSCIHALFLEDMTRHLSALDSVKGLWNDMIIKQRHKCHADQRDNVHNLPLTKYTHQYSLLQNLGHHPCSYSITSIYQWEFLYHLPTHQCRKRQWLSSIDQTRLFSGPEMPAMARHFVAEVMDWADVAIKSALDFIFDGMFSIAKLSSSGQEKCIHKGRRVLGDCGQWKKSADFYSTSGQTTLDVWHNNYCV